MTAGVPPLCVAAVTCSASAVAVVVRQGDRLVADRLLPRAGRTVTGWAWAAAGAVCAVAGRADVDVVVVERPAEPSPRAGAAQRDRLAVVGEVVAGVVRAVEGLGVRVLVVPRQRLRGTVPVEARKSRPVPRAWRLAGTIAAEVAR